MLPTLLACLLAALYAPWVGLAGHPSFRARERASAVLAGWWPLSAAAIDAGLLSPDAEVRARCRHAPPPTWRADLAAACLLAHANERNGLPLADPKYLGTRYVESCPGEWGRWGVADWNTSAEGLFPGERVSLERIRLAVVRLAQHHGIETTNSYYFSPHLFYQHPTGYDFVRLRMRGVPVAGSESWSVVGVMKMGKEWEAIKER